jgi:WGR domain
MSAVHLARIDPSRNMCRFYRLDVQPDLFGGFSVVKEWGRIGVGRRGIFRKAGVFGVCLLSTTCRRRSRSSAAAFDPLRRSPADFCCVAKLLLDHLVGGGQ